MDPHHATTTVSGEGASTRPWFWFVFPLAVFLLVGLSVRAAVLHARQDQALAVEDDPLDAAWKRRTEQFQEMPEFRELLAQSSNPEDPVQTLRRLSTKGLVRLPDEALLQRVTLLTALVTRADVEACAAIFRNSSTPEQLHAAFLKLDPDALDAWVDLAARGAKAELEQTEPPSVSEVETTDALSALVKALPPDEGDRLSKVLDGVAQSSDEDACWAARTLYAKVTRMGEPYDRILARAL